MSGCGRRPGGPTARRREQGLAAVFAAMTLALLTVAGAAAHADLISSEPAAGSTVAGSPATIRLSFSQPLESTSAIQLYMGQFQPVAGVHTSVAGSEMQATLARPLGPATYTVQWLAATNDGHTTEGSYQFAVAAAGSTAANRLAPLVVAVATLLSAGVAICVWFLRRRQRV